MLNNWKYFPPDLSCVNLVFMQNVGAAFLHIPAFTCSSHLKKK